MSDVFQEITASNVNEDSIELEKMEEEDVSEASSDVRPKGEIL